MSAAPKYAKRLCPHHDDHKPSLSVNLATGWGKCFACGWSGRVDRNRTLVEPPSVVPLQRFDIAWLERETIACHDNTAVELMLALRGIDTDTALELGMRARHRDGTDWLVFVYCDAAGRPLYTKSRNADGSKESMRRYPSGAPSALYNLPELAGL